MNNIQEICVQAVRLEIINQKNIQSLVKHVRALQRHHCLGQKNTFLYHQVLVQIQARDVYVMKVTQVGGILKILLCFFIMKMDLSFQEYLRHTTKQFLVVSAVLPVLLENIKPFWVHPHASVVKQVSFPMLLHNHVLTVPKVSFQPTANA